MKKPKTLDDVRAIVARETASALEEILSPGDGHDRLAQFARAAVEDLVCEAVGIGADGEILPGHSDLSERVEAVARETSQAIAEQAFAALTPAEMAKIVREARKDYLDEIGNTLLRLARERGRADARALIDKALEEQ